ncbi:hypothetical protein PG993_011360 [Apiospora rasikravindrae]|uniref:Uncharacterized protein n=1 Tax=Apiospora rasikravindrae TaxID=990691 RepID=A0ABR1SE05_9PEZI
MRDVGIDGGSHADYYLHVYEMSQGLDATVDDDADMPETDLSSYFANNQSSVSDVASDSAASSPSSLFSAGMKSPPSYDRDESEKDSSDPITTPIDYTEARENHWRHPGYHDDEIEPLAWEWSQAMPTIPECKKTGWSWDKFQRDPTAHDVWREAYRDLKGHDAPEPPAPRLRRRPPPPPRRLQYMWQPDPRNPGDMVCAPVYTHPRFPPLWRWPDPEEEEEEEKFPWAKIPCECWHCAAHPDSGWDEVRAREQWRGYFQDIYEGANNRRGGVR